MQTISLLLLLLSAYYPLQFTLFILYFCFIFLRFALPILTFASLSTSSINESTFIYYILGYYLVSYRIIWVTLKKRNDEEK